MDISEIKFSQLRQELPKTGKTYLDYLAPEIGKAYIIVITRDGCPSCEKQKPKLNQLAKRITANHGGKTVFTRIHVKYNPDAQEESLRSKATLGHYFYPTNLILLRTPDRGASEYYRNVSPEMDELEKNIEKAVETATMFEKTVK